MENYIMLDSKSFDEEIKNGVVAVDFFATWCMPCKMLSPVISALAADNDGKAKVAKLDIDLSEDIAIKYNVQTVPTVIFFKDGVEQERSVGFKQKSAFQSIIDKYL